MGPCNKVRIGVIGAGYWGPNLIRNFQQISGVQVTCVCDLSEDRLRYIQGLYPAVRVTQDFKEVVQNPEVDAVCVATPVRHHYEMACKALEHDKHVLVEKPITVSSDEAQKLIDLAERRRRVLLVDHTFEYTPAVNRIKEIVDSGELGDIYYISMSRLNLGLFQKDINVVWDLAPHDISILHYVLQTMPEAVSAHGNANILPGIEDVALVTLQFPRNVLAYLQVSWLDPCKIRRATFVGSKKMLVYDDVEPLEKIKIYDKGVNGPMHYDTFGEFQFSYRYGDIYTPFLANHEPLNLECRHFIECIVEGVKPRTDGVSGLNVVRVLEAAQRSIKNGGTMERVR
jgi:predicted dehydrogenase